MLPFILITVLWKCCNALKRNYCHVSNHGCSPHLHHDYAMRTWSWYFSYMKTIQVFICFHDYKRRKLNEIASICVSFDFFVEFVSFVFFAFTKIWHWELIRFMIASLLGGKSFLEGLPLKWFLRIWSRVWLKLKIWDSKIFILTFFRKQRLPILWENAKNKTLKK